MSGKQGYTGLDVSFDDPVIYRDTFVEHILGTASLEREAARREEIDAKIAAGWGSTDADKIPADWRTRQGPDTMERRERFRLAGLNKPTHWGRRPRISRHVTAR